MLFPDFHLLWLVDEMKKNLPLELDFTNEAANAERVRTMYAHLDYLKVFSVCVSIITSFKCCDLTFS